MSETQLTIRQRIIADDAIRDLMFNVHELPDRAREARNNLVTAEVELDYFRADKEAKDEIENLEAEAAYEASLEVDAAGKKVNSNEQQRGAAARKILLKTPEYLRAVEKHKMALCKKGELALHVGKLRNQLFFILDELKAALAEVQLVAGLCHEQRIFDSLSFIEEKQVRLTKIFNILKEELPSA